VKFLLILCLLIKVTVSARTIILITSDNIAEESRTSARNQVTELVEGKYYNQDFNYKIENILRISKLIFSYSDLPYALTTIELLKYTGNNFFSHCSFKLSCLTSETKHKITLAKKSFSEICWDKSKLETYISLNLSENLLIAEVRVEQKTYTENQFKYAGSQRFTLTGNPPNLTTEIKPLQASMMAGVAIAAGIILHINQSAAWWDGKGTSFYFRDDWDEVHFADKFGHFMGGYFISYVAREALVFSGFNWDRSIFLGSLFGLLAQTYVEFKDGYAEDTGFSASDFAADVFGVTYFYFQHYIPVLQNFSPKWQYTPPGIIGVQPQASTQTFLDNYNSTTAWISVHVRNLIWGDQDSFWPKWLNIGFGYGVNGYCTPNISSRFVIGIDYNLVELLPDGFPFWNWLKQSLNCIKFPAPAIEFSNQGIKFRILYPFNISIGQSEF
jgi:hypothetical protein